jgi:hypothetical protein
VIPFGWKGLDSLTLLDAGVELLSNDLVRVPYRDVDGLEMNAKLFPRPPRKPWWEQRGRVVAMFGLEQLGRLVGYESATIILAEGEGDSLAIRGELAIDHDGVPVVVLGIPGASMWRPSWAAHVRRFYRVYVAGDGDEPGQRMNTAVRRTMPWARPLPMPAGMDARSVIQEHGQAAFLELLDHADRLACVEAALMAAGTRDEALRLIERWSA